MTAKIRERNGFVPTDFIKTFLLRAKRFFFTGKERTVKSPAEIFLLVRIGFNKMANRLQNLIYSTGSGKI